MGAIPQPFAHQKVSIQRLAKSPIIFDTSDPGTGKTLVQILDFAARRRKGGKCMLILATKSLLTSAWEGDFRKFAPDMKVSVAFAENRAKAFAAPADAYATNHDAANWLAKQPASFFAKFDVIVIDESTAFKHHTSQRSKSVGQIIKHFKYRRLLTGTPNSNGVCDLWHQIYMLDNGQRLGKSFFAFRKAACDAVKIMDNPVYVVDKDSNGVPRKGPDGRVLMKAITPVNWIDKESIELTVAALIRDITIRNKFEDCVDIPPNHQYARSFKLSRAHLKAYETMRDDRLLQLRKTTVTAINAAAVAGKLLQIASGAVYDDNGEGAYSPIASERYELILDLVEEREHSIVFFNWVHQRDELIKEAKKRGVAFAVYDSTTSTRDRTAIVKDYQAGEYRVLFAHPQSAGHGLTLTKGTATIWASPTYNLEHFLQGLKRVHRIGQDKKTETIVIVAEGTIDELVWQALQDKNVKLVELLEGLK
jgi:SNF2 family DNA or RNA helicase